MNYIKHTDYPKTDDNVGFVLETYSDDGLLKNPYTVEQVTIYYIERTRCPHETFVETKEWHPELEQTYEELVSTASESAKTQLAKLKNTTRIDRTYYSNAKIVLETFKPVWTQDGKQHIASLKDDNKKDINGKFLFLWFPKDMREGTYLIHWNWKNKKDGKLQSAEKFFTLYPSSEKINSIYRHFVPREKYNFLFDKYIPPMYRVQTTPNDITPEILVKLNRSIGQSLLELDDLAMGLVDLLSPTYIPEGFLPAFANFFNIQLMSSNPTAWRNQIKHALPLFKKKGTLDGLREALDKAGIRLLSLTNLWQVVSPYTWTDGFVVEKDKTTMLGQLSKNPIEDLDLEVALKSTETEEYFILPKNIIFLQTILVPEQKIAVIWNSNNAQNIDLLKGDVVRVRYGYRRIPEDAKNIDSYIRNLPLADQRDETKLKYPIKNWNVKLIEENDPFFDLLITERHSFQVPVTFGKTRTTFLYSEKAFNMDTYNGSLYNSNNPCDIDKDFVDQCSGGQSSKFNVHLEFDQITDDKIEEAKEIIIDYSPFHAILHNMKISSQMTEFVMPPTEKIRSNINNKSPKLGDKVQCSDEVYCQIRYKDGKVINGRMV